jgi:DNA invertase Pin-like site-specific DNA recombinase
MKVALYVRVSTTKQEEENQIRQLHDYCKKSDWEIYDEFIDFISGKEEKRPEYDRLFKEAHQKKFDAVLFWALDRFARSGTLFTLQKLKELENLNIAWHSYTESYISSIGPWKDVVISIFATIAKLEREKISERTKAGLERVKAKGIRLGRKEVPQDVIDRVIELLSLPDPPSYKKISEQVTYKTKYGKVHHISTAFISQIKNNRLKMGT